MYHHLPSLSIVALFLSVHRISCCFIALLHLVALYKLYRFFLPLDTSHQNDHGVVELEGRDGSKHREPSRKSKCTSGSL